jgi:hypothetical protein
MKLPLILAILSVMPAADVPDPGVTPPEVEVIPDAAPPAPILRPAPEALLAMPLLPPVVAPVPETKSQSVTCVPGRLVHIPDGREGEVTSFEDGVCRVLAYGEAYVSLWQDDMLELVYPQLLPRYRFGH